MFDILVNIFVKEKNRKGIGLLCGITSIMCNTLLASSKIIIGLFTHSIAIVSDGLNNLSDLGSNLATIVGFILSEKHPDHDHPYGHGRYEYIAGMIIAFMILLIACNTLKESVLRIINPVKIHFTYIAFIILILSILIKLFMSYINLKGSQMIDSVSLKAASIDSRNDCITTLAAIISLCCSSVAPTTDGIVGSLVSIIVIISGIEILKDTISPLLGKAPDPNLVKEIYTLVGSYDITLGIHDFMLHDYGPSKRYLTFHLEVDSTLNMVDVHNEVDKMEREILEKYNIMTVIHYDPVDTHSQKEFNIRKFLTEYISQINPEYTIHDFRIVKGKHKDKLIFDILVPSDDHITHDHLINLIEGEIKTLKLDYECLIQIDHQ